jgi:hypothetical protein
MMNISVNSKRSFQALLEYVRHRENLYAEKSDHDPRRDRMPPHRKNFKGILSLSHIETAATKWLNGHDFERRHFERRRDREHAIQSQQKHNARAMAPRLA